MKDFNPLEYLIPKASTHYLNQKCTIRQALEKFDFHKFSVVPIIDDDGNYVSSISEGDILRYIKNDTAFNLKKAENVTLQEIEHYRPCKPLNINCTFEELAKLSLEQNFIPLLDDRGKYIGIIKRKSILEYLFNYIPK